MPDIRVSHIRVEGYSTAVDSDQVATLVESIKQHGLINPIRIRYVGDAAYLVAGRRRLEAFKKLGRETIPCTVENEDDDYAEATKISENLHRWSGTDTEKALALDRYTKLIIARSPDHVIRGRGHLKGHTVPGSAPDVSKKTGVPFITVVRKRAHVKCLREVNIDPSDIVKTSLDHHRELESLAKLPINIRKSIVKRAIDGEPVSARAELQTLIGKGKVKPPNPRKKQPPKVTPADAEHALKVVLRTWLDRYGHLEKDSPLVREVRALLKAA